MGKRPLIEMHDFSSEEVQKLLHNKVVVILGDSIQRTVYKDLVRFLQDEDLLTHEELQLKAPDTFWYDHRVEWYGLHRRTNYREVRQYRTDHHLVRAYFITRVYSDYMESILEDFKMGPAPDLLILNSCVWDLNRYLDPWANEPPLEKAFREYRENLQRLFQKLHDILPESCLVIWNTAMPVADKVKRAYLKPGMKNTTTPRDILRANFEGATLACCYQFDVLDLNFGFRFFEEHRSHDGVHWDNIVHRYITKVLMTHVADAWGVILEKKPLQNGIAWNGNADEQPFPRYPPPPPPLPPPPPFHPPPRAMYEYDPPFGQHNPSHDPYFQYDYIPDSGRVAGYFDFENYEELPDQLEERQYGDFTGPADYAHNEGQVFPIPFPDNQGPGSGWRLPPPSNYMQNGRPGNFPPSPRHRSPRGFRGRQRSDRVMRNQRFHREHYRPYTHPYHGARDHPPLPAPPYSGWRGW